MNKLRKKLAIVPDNPGVYLFLDKAGRILYIGKAKNLAKRTKSYFTKSAKEPKTAAMLARAADLDYTVVSTETESLMLENNLIKKYRPPYNVLLRDDKNYQFFKIDYGAEIPQVYPARSIASNEVYPARKIEDRKGAHYFGPYTSALSVKRTKHLLNQIFHLCQNKKIGDKPCFAYHLKRCPGVCIGKISVSEYKKTFRQIEDFLKNRQAEVVRGLTREMKQASRSKKFEKAAIYRDRLRALQNIWEKQKVISAKNENSDFIGLFRTPASAFASVLIVRKGKLLGQEQFELTHNGADREEILSRLINEYYLVASDPPKEIYLPVKLSENAMNKMKLLTPMHGRKKQLLELAEKNAKLNWQKSLTIFQAKDEILRAPEELARHLKLGKKPLRIEGFDISNIQGTNPVGSMVVFINGEPDKSQYRKFKISSKSTPDDVGMMKEMIERRFTHHTTESLRVPPTGGARSDIVRDDAAKHWPLPDLVVIDGGKGQLKAAVSQISRIKYPISVIGLAKRLEEIYLPRRKKPLLLSKKSPALKLLQRIRDEAHRFAITFHKKRRSESMIGSQIDDVPGIGPVTKKLLLRKFGTVSAIRNASLEKLTEEIGEAKARKIKERL